MQRLRCLFSVTTIKVSYERLFNQFQIVMYITDGAGHL